jgi:hypothetical protein
MHVTRLPHAVRRQWRSRSVASIEELLEDIRQVEHVLRTELDSIGADEAVELWFLFATLERRFAEMRRRLTPPK